MKTIRRKRALTLLEIMIVVFLIGLIGSVIGVNMMGSMEKGKAFKTEQAMSQIKDILMLEVANGYATLEEVVAEPAKYLAHSGLVKDPKKFVQDGWGKDFEFSIDGHNNLKIKSEKFNAYDRKQKAKIGKSVTEDEVEED